jgi:hypothetical protein
MKDKIGISDSRVKVFLALMFFFLISLVFITPKSHGEMWTRNQVHIKNYRKFYVMGQKAADYDAAHKQLWKHYEHYTDKRETKQHDAFLDGYLDTASYYTMPGIKRIKWDLENPEWRD